MAEPLPDEPAWSLVAMNISKPTRGQTVETRLLWAAQAGYRQQHELDIQRAAQNLGAYATAGMRLGAVYVMLDAANGELPEQFAANLKTVAAHKPQIWLAVQGPRGQAPGFDQRVVERVRQAADLAEAQGLRVAIYPHANFYVETVADALRVAKAADRGNVGVCFNLCHFLRADPEKDWKAVLKQSGDRLFTVTICGADRGGKDWSSLIQPLDRGDFPLSDLLAALKADGFSGVLAVQDYGIEEPAAETLARSFGAYQQMLRKR